MVVVVAAAPQTSGSGKVVVPGEVYDAAYLSSRAIASLQSATLLHFPRILLLLPLPPVASIPSHKAGGGGGGGEGGRGGGGVRVEVRGGRRVAMREMTKPQCAILQQRTAGEKKSV